MRSRCNEVYRRARKAHDLAVQVKSSIGYLDYLTIGRASLYRVLLCAEGSERSKACETARKYLALALNEVRGVGQVPDIALVLMAIAWLDVLDGNRNHAQLHLDQALEIAERGPMKLQIADVHLLRARLFVGTKSYPWSSPQDDICVAEGLIKQCCYHRRDEEVADAKKMVLGK